MKDKVYTLEAKKRISGKWISISNIMDPHNVWSMVSEMNISADEMIVRGIDGSLYLHIVNGMIIHPMPGDGLSEDKYEYLCRMVNSRLN